MMVFVILGMIFLAFGLMFLFSPGVIAWLGERGNRILFSDEGVLSHGKIAGLSFVIVGFLMFYFAHLLR